MKWQVITVLHLAHSVQWSVTTFQHNPQPHWCKCPILSRLLKVLSLQASSVGIYMHSQSGISDPSLPWNWRLPERRFTRDKSSPPLVPHSHLSLLCWARIDLCPDLRQALRSPCHHLTPPSMANVNYDKCNMCHPQILNLPIHSFPMSLPLHINISHKQHLSDRLLCHLLHITPR